MDDLRWVLALVGALVVGAIYLSSRFERDDWRREREQRHRREKPAMRPRKKEPRMNEPVAVATTVAPGVETDVAPAAPSFSTTTADIAATEALGSGTDTSIGSHAQSAATRNTVVDKSDDAKKGPHFISGPAACAEETVISATEQAQPKTQVKEQTSPPVDETAQRQTEPEISIEAAELPNIMLDANLEDEIVEVDIPQDLSAAEAELQAGSEAEGLTPAEPVQVSLPLGVEPLVLVVTVLAQENQLFTGSDIEEALAAEGLLYGDMRIFHFFAAEKNVPQAVHEEAVFSLANLIEPGYFELEGMADLETPGLSLFCQLPGPLPGNEALECMLDKARGLAVRLDGRMCDDKRNVFTAQAKTHYQDRVAAFERELVLARKKL
jgi:cell division protein ZipA